MANLLLIETFHEYLRSIVPENERSLQLLQYATSCVGKFLTTTRPFLRMSPLPRNMLLYCTRLIDNLQFCANQTKSVRIALNLDLFIADIHLMCGEDRKASMKLLTFMDRLNECVFKHQREFGKSFPRWLSRERFKTCGRLVLEESALLMEGVGDVETALAIYEIMAQELCRQLTEEKFTKKGLEILTGIEKRIKKLRSY